MISEKEKKRLEIEYPTDWRYKIIGDDFDRMLLTINEIVDQYNSGLAPSNISRKGNYISLNLTVLVENEIVRNEIYEQLMSNPSIKIVF
ncbi:MAG: DUF493 domain-containing protein [Chlorobi bacterium]|nr:DUF493 domain-containing protein [Chlorobiota bacterium]